MLSSRRFYSTGKVNQFFQMLLFQPQQFDLLVQRFPPVKRGALDDLPDLLQGKLQFPEQQDLLQGFQRRFVIQPVARPGVFRRGQKPDLVLIPQGAYAHACQPAHFMHRHHGVSPPRSWYVHDKA